MNNGMNAQLFMADFGEQTGLLPGSHKPPRRYLWTDAFAVCNYLALSRQHNETEYLDLASRLVDQVHSILGRHRTDDRRKGWISGLGTQEGDQHPTAGGLRIGKELPEREPDEPFDENLEWERDGQYYHYLTRWMHALCRIGVTSENPIYIKFAAELAERSNRAFIYTLSDGSRKMYWKMSVDLSRPLVKSMGHHDPLDGLISCLVIQEYCTSSPDLTCSALTGDIATLADICIGENWATTDMLGQGTLLADAWRLVQLFEESVPGPLQQLFVDLLDAALISLSYSSQGNILHQPAEYRLAFRELGLAIGLQAIPRIISVVNQSPDLFAHKAKLNALLDELSTYLPIHEQILDFWITPKNRDVPSWTEHVDINTVMLATCLLPDGYLDLR